MDQEDPESRRMGNLEERLRTLEGAASEYRLYVAAQASMKRERRYALLQAAAMLLPEAVRQTAADTSQLFGSAIRFAVDIAENLLAEIEKREKAEAES